ASPTIQTVFGEQSLTENSESQSASSATGTISANPTIQTDFGQPPVTESSESQSASSATGTISANPTTQKDFGHQSLAGSSESQSASSVNGPTSMLDSNLLQRDQLQQRIEPYLNIQQFQSDVGQQPFAESPGSQSTLSANETKSDGPTTEPDSFSYKLAFVFRLCVYPPMKLQNGKLKLSTFHIIWFIFHTAKLVLLTSLTFKIGHCREILAFTVTDGYITLQHTLLKDWIASFETLPYPPAHGQFASYTIDDLKSRIDYTVSQESCF
ncbi:uncharacterized protein LOC132744096, partial [Ruditapes philippinarum]|uniref:uncharacterized protein LOC132744096 n=1 Tax=Ruditapes philippinarum TaxID=129788 RepID=UPI00295BB2E7